MDDGSGSAYEHNETVITHFNPDGDLKLLVGTENNQEIFVVSSKAMSLVCKPWKAMVGPDSKFIEGSSSADAAVPLPDDNINALRILLNAAHFRFSLIPATLSFEGLLELAILCDKYDSAELVQPWLKTWLIHAQTLSLTLYREGWLFISWSFGLSAKFHEVANILVREAELGTNGTCIRSGYEVVEERMPPDILGKASFITQD